ncbi:hypothetical protein JFQ04_004979, partial [Escherichia coli]|nr:hypothetical protein [Escherichia coli]
IFQKWHFGRLLLQTAPAKYIPDFLRSLFKTPGIQLNASCTTPQRHRCFNCRTLPHEEICNQDTRQKGDYSPQFEKGHAIAQSDYCRVLFAS